LNKKTGGQWCETRVRDCYSDGRRTMPLFCVITLQTSELMS